MSPAAVVLERAEVVGAILEWPLPSWWFSLDVSDPRWIVLSDGRPAGVVAASPLDWVASGRSPLGGVAPVVSNTLVEVGFPYRGVGVGPAALRALSGALARLRMPPPIAAVLLGNQAARRCVEAAGMDYAGMGEATWPLGPGVCRIYAGTWEPRLAGWPVC